MFSIEPKRETIVQHSLTITLDEAGAKDFLDDAAWLQRQVRGIYAQWQRPAPVTRVKRVKRGRPRKHGEKKYRDQSSRAVSQVRCGQIHRVPAWLRHQHQAARPQDARAQVPALSAAQSGRQSAGVRAGQRLG